MKEENIINYYRGILSYTLFLQGVIYGITKYNYFILDRKNISAATMAFLSNIFLIVKEGIVEKDNNSFNSLILEETLERNVGIIATQTNNGYEIDNYLFKDKETLVVELRNKIAHGNYTFDLEHNRIILNFDNNEVKIDMSRLSAFVAAGLNSYLKNYKTNEFTRTITYNDKIRNNRIKPILNKCELKGFIKKYRQKIITLKSKDGTLIPVDIIKMFESLISDYGYSRHEKEFYEDRILFEKIYNEKYEIIYENKSFKNVDYDTFTTYFFNIMGENTTFENQTIMLAKELERNENIKNKKINLLIDNLNNLIMLEAIKENNTVDMSILSEKILRTYGRPNNFYLSTYTLVSTLIACFNALFSYGKDNVYKNANKYTTLDNNGLDYSKLDLSFLDIELCNIDRGRINELKLKKDAKYKDLENNNNKIIKINECISNVKDLEIINKLKNNLINLNNKKIEITNEYNNLLEEYNNANNYYNANIDYLRNERIIDGIRNSIAHGNYYIKNNIDIVNSIIVFEDIYEGNLTFKCSVKINDFMEFLDKGYHVINDFISNKKTKTLTK